ncbi:DUF5825 family protein [Streptomyces paromomycinus]|uniref:Uncharacterized protein n=1 Tax=Streptomyces paromomycinus TaxID=92743 RepID=A0A401WGA2_STREY|nr:DUF5825 family protein [Streptomyces paromomycinus]GCD48346.1 hypothetical protein GKJPGBOP_08143 [Streptomyces paromomycinus]
MSPLAVRLAAPVTLALWRERDVAARNIPGVYAGTLDLLGDQVEGAVADLAAHHVQFARLPRTVDLTDRDGAAAVTALVAVRELTAFGIAVEWSLRLPGTGAGAGTGAPADWQPLSHLHPPAAVLRDDSSEPSGSGDSVDSNRSFGSRHDIAVPWRDSFHAAKCGYRRGPGFIEVRDRRGGSFKRLVIRTHQHDQLIQALLRGVPETGVPSSVVARYLPPGLIHRAGRFLWWTPYRIRRWPLSTTIP